jgi:hypothetical protein
MAVGGEALGFAALARDGPDVIGVAERDAVLGKGRRAQQQVLIRAGGRVTLGGGSGNEGGGERKQNERKVGAKTHHGNLHGNRDRAGAA